MAKLLAWLDAGHLRPPPVRAFAFNEVAAAHRALESARTVGKLALTL